MMNVLLGLPTLPYILYQQVKCEIESVERVGALDDARPLTTRPRDSKPFKKNGLLTVS